MKEQRSAWRLLEVGQPAYRSDPPVLVGRVDPAAGEPVEPGLGCMVLAEPEQVQELERAPEKSRAVGRRGTANTWTSHPQEVALTVC